MTSQPRSMSRRLLFPASGLIALCAFVHACGGGGSSGGGNPPPAPNPSPGPTTFVSTSQFPANSSVDVPVQPLILVGFNDIVNPVTMTSTTVSLNLGAAPVASTLTYVACSNQVQLVPNAALNAGAVYTVNLTSGLMDDDGESLTAMAFSFTTISTTDTTRPTFTAAGFAGMPNPGTETTEVLLTWNDGTDGANPAGTISYRVYQSNQPVCFNYATPVAQTGPGVLQAVVPGLNSRTLYSFVVRAVDAAGNESLNTTQVNVTTFTSFIQNVYPVVTTFCAACHNPPNGQAWMNTPQITMDYTTSQTVYNTWVGVVPSWPAAANAGMFRVDPGDPNNSFLW
ncbi:MAG TPA: Ig-like domain-containing protein, partial [Planctomycetota bacterium]|nr:Ig-like domain-containing protein [Planctomycetota bacterium]